MAPTPLAWGPRAGKTLCAVELDLPADIVAPYPLDDVLRMCIDFCVQCLFRERQSLDPQPPPPKSLADFGSFSEMMEDVKRRREEAETSPWIPVVEVIPPTTLYTDCSSPGVRINFSLPPEKVQEVRTQFERMWNELVADVRLCGVGSFLELYRKPFGIIGGGPPVKAKYPLNRWGPVPLNSGLICVKNSQRLTPHC